MDINEKTPIYHEKQVRELCALHALNNLFQTEGAYSKAELDAICRRLSPDAWLNPHKSLLGLGNYDVNVIMAALQEKGCEALWFDKRKDPSCLNLSNICGFILNVPSDYKLGFVMLPLRRRHWIAIRQIEDDYYNLDSKLDSPHIIGKSDELIAYLKEQLDSRDKELFVVVTKEVEEKQLWLRQPQPYGASASFTPSRCRSAADDMKHCDSPTDSLDTASYSMYDFNDRDAECLKVTDIRSCLVSQGNT